MFTFGLAVATAMAAPSGRPIATVPLWRMTVDEPRVYVSLDLPGGIEGLFLVDTGSDRTLVAPHTAETLGLERRGRVTLEGLLGREELSTARASGWSIGGLALEPVEVAIGLPGVGKIGGVVALDGLLGTDVLGRFTVEIDGHANLLRLYDPKRVRPPSDAAPLALRDNHWIAPVVLADLGQHVAALPLAIDTAATGITLLGEAGRAWTGPMREGLEPVRGLVASPQRLQTTRTFEVDHVAIGGTDLRVRTAARWLPDVTAAFDGVVGYDVLTDRDAWWAPNAGWWWVGPSKKPAAEHDLLAHLLAASAAPSRMLEAETRLARAEWLAARGDPMAAQRALYAILDDRDPDVLGVHDRARVALARILRAEGEPDAARDLLAPLDPGTLVDAGELIAVVRGLVLADRWREAADVANAAAEARPESAEAAKARAEAAFALGALDDAREALDLAVRLDPDPDGLAWLRARLARARGQHDAEGALLRAAFLEDPTDDDRLVGWAWVAAERWPDALRADLAWVTASVQPAHAPYGGIASAHRALGDATRAAIAAADGIVARCPRVRADGADPCSARLLALAGATPETAMARLQGPSASEPAALYARSLVLAALGDRDGALAAALEAAKRSPDRDAYLWHIDVLREMLTPPED
jgi:tetratricopeptide (TPR) repeat protein